MNKFFTVNVNPTMTAAQQAVFADGDLMIDWYAFDIPNGGNKLISAYLKIYYLSGQGILAYQCQSYYILVNKSRINNNSV